MITIDKFATALTLIMGLIFLSFPTKADVLGFKSESELNSWIENNWAKHCTVDGITAVDEDEQEQIESAAIRCTPTGACLLSCMRSQCGANVGGGCYHLCGMSPPATPRSDMISSLLLSAQAFADKTHFFCSINEP